MKSLCRFKCVSKSWLSTISTPKFVHSHFDRSRSNPKLLISISTITGRRRDLFIADQTEQEKKSHLVLRHQTTLSVKEIHVTELVTVAGLELSIGSPDVFVVTNAITKASVAFSRAFPEQAHDRPYVYFGFDRVYFGFDPIDGKHKVLESFHSPSVNRMDHRICVVSASDSGNWRSIEGPPDVYFSCRQGVYIDGVIYSSASMENGSCIVAFDVRSEKFQVVKLSINGRLRYPIPYNPYRYIEFEGKLAIVDYPFSNKVGETTLFVPALDLWVMEDFENQVWSFKSYCLQPSFTRTRQLIGTTIDGELIFVEFGNKDEPFILPGYRDCGKFVDLPEEDMPFSFYFFNIKTGIFWSKEVRLPPGYPLTGKVAICATSFVERL